MSPLLVLSSCPDRASAEQIADALLARRVAACVNLLPGIESRYHWKGRIESSVEVILLIKTARDRLDALTAAIRSLHPYELPEVIAVEPASGLDAYLRWIVQETRASEDSA